MVYSLPTPNWDLGSALQVTNVPTGWNANGDYGRVVVQLHLAMKAVFTLYATATDVTGSN
jgi:hypothetical protein